MFWFLLWKSGLLLHIQLQADSTLSRLHYINSHLFNPSPPPKGFWIPLHLYPNQLSSFKIHLAIWLLFVCLLIALVRSPFENLSSTPSTDQYICFLSSLCVWQNISVVPELLFESIANDPGLQTRPKWGQQLVNKGFAAQTNNAVIDCNPAQWSDALKTAGSVPGVCHWSGLVLWAMS